MLCRWRRSATLVATDNEPAAPAPLLAFVVLTNISGITFSLGQEAAQSCLFALSAGFVGPLDGVKMLVT